MADPGFLRAEANPRRGRINLLFGKNVAENYMKRKEIGPRAKGGRLRAFLVPPLPVIIIQTPTGFGPVWLLYWYIPENYYKDWKEILVLSLWATCREYSRRLRFCHQVLLWLFDTSVDLIVLSSRFSISFGINVSFFRKGEITIESFSKVGHALYFSLSSTVNLEQLLITTGIRFFMNLSLGLEIVDSLWKMSTWFV